MPYKDPEKHRLNSREWTLKNPKKRKESQKKYREKHKDIIHKKQRKYYKKNIDIIRFKQNLLAKKRREKFKKIKGVCKSCGKHLFKDSKYYCEKCLILKRKYKIKRIRKSLKNGFCIDCGEKVKTKWYCIECLEKHKMRMCKKKFLTLQKISKKRIPKCIECGETDIRVLTKNHKETPKEQLERDRKSDINSRILNGKRKIDDLEVRCYNCNFRYEYERGKRFFNRKLFEKMLKEEKIIRKSDKIK